MQCLLAWDIKHSTRLSASALDCLPPLLAPVGRAVTIATRYAAVRRQTTSKLGEPELQVRDSLAVAGRGAMMAGDGVHHSHLHPTVGTRAGAGL